MKSFPSLLFAGLLAGCALGPDYERPVTPMAEAYPEAGKGAAAVRAEWWKSFGDAELDALVAKAFAANTDLRQAVARVEQAAAVLGEVEGAALPQVDANVTSQQIKISEGGFNPNLALNGRIRTNQRAALSTAFELDFWGRLRRAEEGARAQLLAADHAAGQVRLTLVAAVVRAHPHDVPDFLPAVLAAFARAAQEPAPLGVTVKKTVAEFRRSHGDAWDAHAAAFTEEQLADVLGAGSNASYFA